MRAPGLQSLVLPLSLLGIVMLAPAQAQQPAPNATASESSESQTAVGAADKLSTTSHSVGIDGVEVRYTATAGTLVVRDPDGKPRANVFFVAYVRDGQTDRRARPITFFYNGGPGSASIWLHMGRSGHGEWRWRAKVSSRRRPTIWWTTSTRCSM